MTSLSCGLRWTNVWLFTDLLKAENSSLSLSVHIKQRAQCYASLHLNIRKKTINHDASEA